MDREVEIKKQLLLNLLQRLGLTDYLDPQTDSSLEDSSHDSVIGVRHTPFRLVQEDSLPKPGEIPAVQDRFHALIKRRLLIEAQRKPPLFPWEEEIAEYEAEPNNSDATHSVLAAASVWMTQVRKIQLPVPMPESVLTELLARCQAVLFSSLREGAKLVRAVDPLFPGQAQLLNDIAGYVMVSPARSTSESLQQMATAAGAEFPERYESAIETQQMALSLLAAREIMSTLCLPISPQQPQFEREWLTELGAFTLRAVYPTGPGDRLRIEAELPCGGSLQFQGQEFRSVAERDDAGRLSLEIQEFMVDQVYPLEVLLGEQDLLTFALYLQSGN